MPDNDRSRLADRLAGWSPASMKRRFLDAWCKAAGTWQGQRSLVKALDPVLDRTSPRIPKPLLEVSPYAGLGQPAEESVAVRRGDVVIITARFRSGSTLLWSLFRALPGVTAFYEPFNEREWFRSDRRGERVDQTHRGVQEYWSEYSGKDFLAEHFDPAWATHRLFMAPDAWNPEMKAYIELLVESADGIPVLAFNRIDLRLPWIRHHFPRAKIVHLYRHPRDQWCSCLGDIAEFPSTAFATEFPDHDHFYLLHWLDDLGKTFPFLLDLEVLHPYALFYALWRLSFLYGQHFGDHSLGFEDLVSQPEREITHLLEAVGMVTENLEPLCGLIDPPRLGKWRAYAEPEWFRDLESQTETLIREYFKEP